LKAGTVFLPEDIPAIFRVMQRPIPEYNLRSGPHSLVP
jgi:hypothetical protein